MELSHTGNTESGGKFRISLKLSMMSIGFVQHSLKSTLGKSD